MSVFVELQSGTYCGVSRVRVVELERFKRLVYTLHPKATSLRMHSMRKRRVTTKFTMVKKSNKTGGASWYYKIHPTHRRNTTQILIIPLCALHIINTSLCPLSINLRSLSSFASRAELPSDLQKQYFSSQINYLAKKYTLSWDKRYFSNYCYFYSF